MNEQMTQEIMKRIDVLAVKLGVTGQYLWGVLVKQAEVEAIEDILSALLFGVLAGIGLYIIKKMIKIWQSDEYDEVGIMLGSIACFIAVVVGLIGFVCCMISSITPIMNPEFFALRQILNSVK